MEEACFRPPCRGLVPSELAESLAVGSAGDGDGGSVALSVRDDVPTLSDRIVTIEGTKEQQESACREVLRQLCQLQGGEGEAKPCLFVVLVPCSAAAAVVGTRGQRVRALIEESGAQIEVKREVVHGLNQQPVVVKGKQEQVLRGAMGVVEVLEELASRGRLGPADFALPFPAAATAASVEGLTGVGPSSGSSLRGRPAPALAPAPTPVVLVLDMGVTGYIIGRQGHRLAELQRSTGARISLAAKGGSLPGMRCGDRILEIGGDTEEQRDQGLRAVLAAVTEAPLDAAGAGRAAGGSGGGLAVLVPVGAVGYVIGKGGQTLKEITSRFSGVSIEIQQDGPPIAGARAATICGDPAARADAALALMGKVDELRSRLAQGASASAGPAASPSQRGGDSLPSAGMAAALAPVPAPSVARPPAPQAPAESWSSAEGAADPTASWTARTPAERALLAGIQASGVLNHQLTVRVPEDLLSAPDVEEVTRRSGARLEVGAPGGDGADPGYRFVTVVGQRVSTSLAALYLQELMAARG